MYIYKLVPNGYNKFEKGMKKRYKSILLLCNEMKKEKKDVEDRIHMFSLHCNCMVYFSIKLERCVLIFLLFFLIVFTEDSFSKRNGMR